MLHLAAYPLELLGDARPDRPAVVPLRSAVTTFGRDPASSTCLLDSTEFRGLISRSHARVVLTDGVPVLHDHSLNGCTVDGKLVRGGASLTEGSIVVFGSKGSKTEFRYKVVTQAAPAKRKRSSADTATGATGPPPAAAADDEPPPATGGAAAASSAAEPPPATASSSSAAAAAPAPLPAAAADAMLEELQCCVCRELLCRPHQLRCSHTFCADCIWSWSRRDASCAICRAALDESPPLLIRQLDQLTGRLASTVLQDAERRDWQERAAAWDAQPAEALRGTWRAPPPAAEPSEQPVTEVLVGYAAASGRSTCRRCLHIISAGELRHGLRSRVPMFNTVVVAWHHARCLPLTQLAPSADQVHGLDALAPEDQAAVRRAFVQSSAGSAAPAAAVAPPKRKAKSREKSK